MRDDRFVAPAAPRSALAVHVQQELSTFGTAQAPDLRQCRTLAQNMDTFRVPADDAGGG
ncbi:hypothetical protein [Arthrobacter sp. CAU 1506]|uniref:hypothetical protein n=1 Tax=Arthrobacter sp. CAU 1506 TaxID=2560052 RepID=UPI00145CAD14|nr:hypothetical protein [Arthrobacter sp. CAU 1506]